VLTGFDIETRAQIVQRASELLHPEGCIALGAGEIMPEGCDGLTFANGVIARTGAARRAA
jgi:chemotaxis methyl-accepting protein methylase